MYKEASEDDVVHTSVALISPPPALNLEFPHPANTIISIRDFDQAQSCWLTNRSHIALHKTSKLIRITIPRKKTFSPSTASLIV